MTYHTITRKVADKLFSEALADPSCTQISYTGHNGRVFLTISGTTWEIEREAA